MPYKDPLKNKEAKRKYRENNRKYLSEQSKLHYANNRERWYAYELNNQYGVTLEQYKDKLNAQNGVCAICGGVNKNGWRLCLDHDHTTNRPRGILCRKCNTLLGLVNDNRDLLHKAISYLEEYRYENSF